MAVHESVLRSLRVSRTRAKNLEPPDASGALSGERRRVWAVSTIVSGRSSVAD